MFQDTFKDRDVIRYSNLGVSVNADRMPHNLEEANNITVFLRIPKEDPSPSLLELKYNGNVYKTEQIRVLPEDNQKKNYVVKYKKILKAPFPPFVEVRARIGNENVWSEWIQVLITYPH